MFKIYDLNYQEVSFPVDKLGYGLKALDLNLGPVIYNSIYSEGDGASGAPVKRYPADREVSIRILFTAADTIDWRLKRDEVYAFFRRLGVFYVAESHEPFKLLKVIVDEGYSVERPVTIWGQAEIPLKVLKPVFRQSLHTTLDIDQEGIQFNDKWAYGMGTWFPENYWQYEFKGIPVNENILNTYNFRKTSGTSPVTLLPSGLRAGEYAISFEYTKNSVPNGIDSFLLYAGSVVIRIDPNAYIDKESKRVYGKFTINSSQSSEPLLIYAGRNAVQSLDNDVSFNDVKIEEGQQVTPFEIPDNTPKINVTFYNAGDEEVRLIQQKDSEIRLTVLSIPPNNLIDIDDGSTTFKIWKDFKIGDVLKIKGDSVTLNGVNVLGDTNFNFLTVKTGWNYWDVRGVSNFDFKIDFRYLYD